MESLLQMRLLGGCAISVQGAPVSGLETPRLQALLGYLALHRDAPLGRAQVAFQLWPDSTEAQALANLRGLLRRLRIALPQLDQLLRSDRQSLTWDAQIPWSLDVADFQNALDAARDAEQAGDLPAARSQLQTACRLYQGDLLPGLYDEWLLPHREQLRDACLAAIEHLAALAEQQGDTPAAIAATRQVLQLDTLHEPAHRALIRLLAHSGDRAGALRAYHSCVTTLERELGVGPGAATVQEYERAQHVGHDSAPPPALAPPAVITPLVGRQQEYNSLQTAWRQTNVGAPGVVLIAGEAGIGKTRLAEALAAWLGRQGVPVATATCYATTGTLAYAPLVTWLRELPAQPLEAPWLRELSRLLPELLAARPDLRPPEPLSEPWQRTRLFQALAHGLLSGRQALLLILDDLQWCDPDTLDWLLFLLTARHNGVRTSRLLVVATVRSEDHAVAPRLQAWQAQLSRQTLVTCIELGPLSQGETGELAGQLAGHALASDQHAQIYAETEGNPLFVVELVRAGFAQAAGTRGQPWDGAQSFPALPHRLRQVLEARLAQLSPEARAVIELAAVIGHAFTYRVLARAAVDDEARLVACLDEAWRRRIIREQEADTYDFSHARLRDAAYAGLSQSRRRLLHRRVAEALVGEAGTDAERVAGLAAPHYAAAGLPQEAISAYRRAAQGARRIFAHAEARTALEQAVALLGQLPAEDRQHCASMTYEELGDLQLWRAEYEPAQRSYQVALDATAMANRIGQARLHRKIGRVLDTANADLGKIVAYYTAAEALLGDPDDSASSDWWAEWCDLQLDYGWTLYWWNHDGQMTARLARMQPFIERHCTPLQRAETFSLLGAWFSRQGRYAPSEECLGSFRAALAVLPPDSGPERRASYQFRLGFALLWNHAFADAEHALRDALAQAEQTGDVALQTRCLAYLTLCFRRQGWKAPVADYARRTLQAARNTKMHDYLGAALASQAWLAWHQGQLDEAARLGRQAQHEWDAYMSHYPFQWQALWPLIGVALAQERDAEAIDHARRLLDPGQHALAPTIEAPLASALAAWEGRRPAEARALLEHALETALESGHT